MKSSISKKMDMVKNVFLKQKKLEEDLLSVEDWMLDNHTHVFIDEYFPERQLLTESKSKKKISKTLEQHSVFFLKILLRMVMF